MNATAAPARGGKCPPGYQKPEACRHQINRSTCARGVQGLEVHRGGSPLPSSPGTCRGKGGRQLPRQPPPGGVATTLAPRAFQHFVSLPSTTSPQPCLVLRCSRLRVPHSHVNCRALGLNCLLTVLSHVLNLQGTRMDLQFRVQVQVRKKLCALQKNYAALRGG